ncbi:MAG: pyridoxamine 5'-phosphate oxidase family protein [Terriglobales bacterium]
MVKKTSVRKHVAPRASRPHAPGYGLPTTSKGLLPWKWAADRLTKSREYWIATTSTDGAPHVMVIWGLWWENEFCFSTGSQSRKASNLKANPKCVICNEDAEEAVIVEGIAKRMRDVPLIRKFLSIYGRKYKFDMSGMAGDMLSLKEPIFVVAPRKVFGLAEKTFATRATRWKFGK